MNIFSKNCSTLNSAGIKYLKLGALVLILEIVMVGGVVAVQSEVVLVEAVDVHILLAAANVVDAVLN